jgi:hypothetical protein
VIQAVPGSGEVAATYLRLGIEHILFGFDHLSFVLALVILVRGWKRVAITVTAFTIAHSMTLVAARFASNLLCFSGQSIGSTSSRRTRSAQWRRFG